MPREKLLQQIWQHQRLQRDQLATLDGRPVRVLHPGFWNHEAGPDFRDAIFQIGPDGPRSGDVEIDLSSRGWRGHGHDVNPAFRNVALHVVWDGEAKTTSALPTVAIKSRLDAPLPELELWLGNEDGRAGDLLAGNCCAPLRGLPAETRAELIRQAAQVRLEAKAAQLQAQARRSGWEQAFWEGVFAALGYKHNVWPMRRLAELLPVLDASGSGGPAAPFAWQARLLGVSGLLPVELPRLGNTSADYVRRVWEIWWRERGPFTDLVLPKALWRLHGLRPANHPQRRLALAAHWLAGGEVVGKIEAWLATELPAAAAPGALLEILQIEHDDFWSRHWTMRAASLPKPQPLLGAQRLTDLAVNVVLPWLWTRARAGANDRLKRVAEHRYFTWPAGEDNAALRMARRRLFGGDVPRLRTAAEQQGLLQIVCDFCHQSNALCESCRFPELVKSLG